MALTKVMRGRLFCLAVILNVLLVACSNGTSNKSEVSTKQSVWSYDEVTGPEYWGDLAPMYSACIEGSEQSPINLQSARVTHDQQYEGHQIRYEPTTFILLHNEHTIQANAITESSSIVIEGEPYQLAQFHFHTPSEHQINSQDFDMELHFVHQNKDEELAVIGLMIKEGKENEILAPLWEALPNEESDEEVAKKYLIDVSALLPMNQTSFHYDGSLTTPPCTEEVRWVVLEQPIELSHQQVLAFKQLFSNNNRPVQPLNERKIIKK